MIIRNALILGTALLIAGCKTTPEPIEEPVIEIKFDPIRNCYPIEMLTKVDIPAVTKTVTAIVLIDNPPYEPIEREEEREVLMEPARTAYVNPEGQEVENICPNEPVSETSTDG